MVRYEAVDEENVSPVEEANLPDKKYKIELNQTTSLTEIKVSPTITIRDFSIENHVTFFFFRLLRIIRKKR